MILAALADEKVPAQTIAPKFTGRFNKGADYVGDLAQFEKEFHDDPAVIAHAIDKLKVLSYLRLLNLRLGLVINFHVAVLKDGVHRVVNNLNDPETPPERPDLHT